MELEEILAALDAMPTNAVVTMSLGNPAMGACSFRKVADDRYQGVHGRHIVNRTETAGMIKSVCETFGCSIRYGN